MTVNKLQPDKRRTGIGQMLSRENLTAVGDSEMQTNSADETFLSPNKSLHMWLRMRSSGKSRGMEIVSIVPRLINSDKATIALLTLS